MMRNVPIPEAAAPAPMADAEDPVAQLETLHAHHTQALQAGNMKAAKYFKQAADAHVAAHTAMAKQMQGMQSVMKVRTPTAPMVPGPTQGFAK